MTQRQRKKDDEILRALAVLENPDATEAEADAAFQALARRLPKPSPRPGFAARVMYAVQQAPLPGGRVALETRPSLLAKLRLKPTSAMRVSGRLRFARPPLSQPRYAGTSRFVHSRAVQARLVLVGAAALAGVAALWVAFLSAPVALPIFARVFTFAVQACLLFIPPLTAGLDLWALISTVARALSEAATSPEVLTVLAAISSVGALSFGALTRLLSTRAAEPQ